MVTSNHFALVTGASKGLGKNIAMELANRGYDLILVALPGEGLEEFIKEPVFNSVRVICRELDLTDKEKLYALANEVNENYQLCMLVNNAGIGCNKAILDVSSNFIDKIIQLNITAPTLLIHQFLPNLLKYNGPAYILNVSSMASFSPMAYKTVYPASKRFIHDFSRGLQHELKDTNVQVTVTHPGPMATTEELRLRLDNHGWIGKVMQMSPEDSARLTISKMLKKQVSIIPGWINRLNWLMMSLLPPRVKMPLISGQFKKQADA